MQHLKILSCLVFMSDIQNFYKNAIISKNFSICRNLKNILLFHIHVHMYLYIIFKLKLLRKILFLL